MADVDKWTAERAKLRRIDDDIDQAEAQIRILKQRRRELLDSTAPYAIGDLYRDRKGRIWKIVRTEGYTIGQAHAWGVTKLKDGSWGKKQQLMWYDWNKVESEAA